jgi:hypothetical protein
VIALTTIDVINLPNQDVDVVVDPLQEIVVEQAVVINVNPATFYEGEYEVTPKFEAQTLKTADRLLTKDVIIEEIPYAEVSNNAGGTTVTIGREV